MSRTFPNKIKSEVDQDKLKTLVHYICWRCHDPEMLGATKLNKILWYSEVLSFLKTGQPITGETYVKQQFGPVSKHLLRAIEKLQKEGALVVRDAQFFDNWKKEYIALTEPDISKFNANEISNVDLVMDVVCHKHTATSISMASHDRIWELAEIGEEIPLYAVLASRLGEITDDDIRWAKQELSKQA